MMSPAEILNATIHHGRHKVDKRFLEKTILGFIGGAMISLGYLLYIRVISSVAHELGSLASWIGACVFPIGLIVILMAGGELITGNMMAVSVAWFAKKVSMKELIGNWIVITIFNVIGAIFVAYVFGHFVGLLDGAPFKEETIAVAQAKINMPFFQALVSGIGCNWFVGLALWLSYGTKDAGGK
ncbi:MAG: formate/nitrite transporter family protein, partial [Streptococcaceae bacterium]|nr:formate/nitrite transporter family protein [Streptococcaceae bacterium]